MEKNIAYRETYMSELKKYFGVDQRRINHGLKVLTAVETIMDGESIAGQMRRVITITAILHDVGIKIAEQKYNSSAGPYQELEGPPIVKEILSRWGESEEIIERVAYIVGGHHTSSMNNGLDFQVIWEADLFVNIEEDGLTKDREKLAQIIGKNFVTTAGLRMAQQRYLQYN